MKRASLAPILVIFQIAIIPAWADDDLGLQRMATCQDSWLTWSKDDPGQLKKFGDRFRSDFSPTEGAPFLVPKRSMTVGGLRVMQAFPNSIGMAVGFSIVVGATFDATKRTLEKMLGKPLEECETGDNMRTCSLEIGEKRTFMLMAEDKPNSAKTLLGCYYYYEK